MLSELSRIKVGKNRLGIQNQKNCETRRSFAFPSGRKAARVAVWIEDCVDGSLENFPISGFMPSWFQIVSFGGPRLGFQA